MQTGVITSIGEAQKGNWAEESDFLGDAAWVQRSATAQSPGLSAWQPWAIFHPVWVICQSKLS